MIKKRKREGIFDDKTDFLDLAIYPGQKKIIDPTVSDLTCGTVLKWGLEANVGKRMASRTLNILGEQVGSCGWANGSDRMEKLKQCLNLAKTLESMTEIRTRNHG